MNDRLTRLASLTALALGCVPAQPGEETALDFSDIPVQAAGQQRADGEVPVQPIGCGHLLEAGVNGLLPYRLFEFEGAQGQVVDFALQQTGGEANLQLALFALHPELEGEPLATGDACHEETGDPCLRQVVLPLDATYRLLVVSESREANGGFVLEMQCEQAPGGADEPEHQPARVGAGCRPDVFFVELAPGERAAPRGFVRGFADALDDLGFAGLAIEPVLPKRRGFDGDRRFFRVIFPGAVPEDGLCDVVEALRGQASAIVPGREWRVGRECAVRPLGVEAFAEGDMLDWHLERVGVEPQAPGLPVDVAIIDTGVDEVMSRELGVAETDVVGGGEERHGHGAAMALYTRQVAPDARIHAVRIMDADGVGDIADMARGIDKVLFETHPRRRGAAPLVINISAGWPPELSRRRALTGAGGCATLEDEVGESVRYTLDVARRLERGWRPITVVAAAGNRPGRASVTGPLFAAEFETTDEGYSRCDGERAGWFFPAEYQHECRPLALGVGAVDARDRPSVISMDGAEPDLVAPGELVYAARDGASVRPADVCAEAAVVSRPGRYVLTGTSVPTALTSGAVARMQSQALLRSAWVIRLLRETAVPLGRGDVRRLDVARALESLSCRALLRCTRRDRDCSAAAARCALDAGADAGREPGWPADYDDAIDLCATSAEAGAWADQADCGAAGCEHEALPDRHSSGYVGPSPDWPGCPDCALISSGGGVFKLVAQPYPGLGSSTTLKDPVLEVSDGTTVVYKSISGTWSPGVTRVVTLSLPGSLLVSKLSAKLVTTVIQPSKPPVRDVAGLRVF